MLYYTGTRSDHVREKDGVWAVFAWMSIVAKANEDPEKPRFCGCEGDCRKSLGKVWKTFLLSI